MHEVKAAEWPQLLFAGIAISHVGWIYETCLFAIMHGGIHDRGFVTMPFCPIYGITILVIYWLLGTPAHGGLLLSRVSFGGHRMLIYFLLASLIPAASEFIGGEVMERISGQVLWSYESYTYNLGKYVCLEIAVLWGVLIFVVMCFFDRFIRLISRIPRAPLTRLSLSLSALIALDFIGNVIISAAK